MKKRGRGGRDYIDRNKLRVQREAEEEIDFLVQFANESDFLAKVKVWKPNATSEELAEFSRLFRAAKNARVPRQ